MGADHVIDYTQEDFTRNKQRYDLILAVNGYHSISVYRRALRPHGNVCPGRRIQCSSYAGSASNSGPWAGVFQGWREENGLLHGESKPGRPGLHK